MKQLLTLNEAIEDMKNRPTRGFSKESFGSNCSMFYLHSSRPSYSDGHLATVVSQSEMESIYQQEEDDEETVFKDIQNLVNDEGLDCSHNTISFEHQISNDSGFLE